MLRIVMIVVFIGTILGVILHQVTADWSVSVVIWPHHGIHVGLQQTTPYLPSLNHIQTLPSNSYTRLWSVTYYLFNSYCHTWTVICLKPHTHLDATKTKLTTHTKKCLRWQKINNYICLAWFPAVIFIHCWWLACSWILFAFLGGEIVKCVKKSFE